MTPDEKVQKWKRKCNQCWCEIKSEEIFCWPTCAYNYARQLELEKLKIVVSQSISREAVEELINRYKRLEEWEKDNIWWCALRCFIKDLNSLLLNRI